MKLITPILAFSLVLTACGSGLSSDNLSTNDVTVSETHEVSATESSVTGGKLPYVISYDSSKWTSTPSTSSTDSEYDFEHVDGDVYAMIIPERIEIPMDSLKEAALQNALAVAEDALVTFDEIRTVNGVEMTAMKMTGTIMGIPFEYYGYYYSGNAGTIQFLTYTSANLAPQYQADLDELLNGLSITE